MFCMNVDIENTEFRDQYYLPAQNIRIPSNKINEIYVEPSQL